VVGQHRCERILVADCGRAGADLACGRHAQRIDRRNGQLGETNPLAADFVSGKCGTAEFGDTRGIDAGHVLLAGERRAFVHEERIWEGRAGNAGKKVGVKQDVAVHQQELFIDPLEPARQREHAPTFELGVDDDGWRVSRCELRKTSVDPINAISGDDGRGNSKYIEAGDVTVQKRWAVARCEQALGEFGCRTQPQPAAGGEDYSSHRRISTIILRLSIVQEDTTPPASYQFTDYSVTRPALTRLWFARLFPLLPRWMAANVVTLLSCGSLLTVLAFSLAPNFWGWPESAVALLFFIALQFYVAGDHLDGMQAVATRTTSPLGDFLDHYCDFWAGAILIFGLWSLVRTGTPALLYALTVILVLAFGTTYAEREAVRRLHFTRLGALEANLILAAFLLSWTVPAVRDFWRAESPLAFPRYLFAIGIVAAMGLGAVVVIIQRMRRLPLPLGIMITATIALMVFVARQHEMPPVEGWLLIAMFGGRYVAQVMHGYLVPGRRSWPDPVAVTVILALLIWDVRLGIPTGMLRSIVVALDVYLALALLITTVRIFTSLRRYWIWVNRADAI